MGMNRRVRCWGADSDGVASPPRRVKFRSVSAANGTHVCGLRVNRKVRCWGRNHLDQAKVPPALR